MAAAKPKAPKKPDPAKVRDQLNRGTSVKDLKLAPCWCGAPMWAGRLIELLRLRCEAGCGVRFEPQDKGVVDMAERWNKLRGWIPPEN